MSALFRSEFTQGWKHIYLPHAQTAIYDSKVNLFLKQGISRQLGCGWTQLLDLNVRIQQLTWSLIFYKKYSTSLSTIVLVVFTTANFGGFSNFCRYYARSQTGKSTGYRPTLKPLVEYSVCSHTCCELVTHVHVEYSVCSHTYCDFVTHLKYSVCDHNCCDFVTHVKYSVCQCVITAVVS